MGGPNYDREVYSSPGATSSSGFHFSQQSSQALDATCADPSLFPKGRRLICAARRGISTRLDVTGSMGDAVKLIRDKMPMFHGQIELRGYLKDFAMNFGAIGDINGDDAPLQVGDFAQGLVLDDWIAKLYLEKGGGGQGRESYEMMAYFDLNCVDFTHPQRERPFLFYIGDEGFYPEILPGDVMEHFGTTIDKPLSALDVFKRLSQKYHFYMLHVPYTSGARTDEAICREWKGAIGENFRVLKEPKSVVDVILGIIALITKSRTLEEYEQDMKGRDQTLDRIKNVRATLEGVGGAIVKSGTNLPEVHGARKPSGKSKRIN